VNVFNGTVAAELKNCNFIILFCPPDLCKSKKNPCRSTSKCEIIQSSSGTSHRCVGKHTRIPRFREKNVILQMIQCIALIEQLDVKSHSHHSTRDERLKMSWDITGHSLIGRERSLPGLIKVRNI
jgi:hypothetical protein